MVHSTNLSFFQLNNYETIDLLKQSSNKRTSHNLSSNGANFNVSEKPVKNMKEVYQNFF